METKATRLKQLDWTVKDLLATFRKNPIAKIQIYEEWDAQDVLAHVTFWHESFARNVNDIAKGIKPTPLKGKFIDLNQGGVEMMRGCSLEQVIARFRAAHRTVGKNILNPKIKAIPYKQGSRDYSPAEHLDIVNKHIGEHLRDIKMVCKIK